MHCRLLAYKVFTIDSMHFGLTALHVSTAKQACGSTYSDHMHDPSSDSIQLFSWLAFNNKLHAGIHCERSVVPGAKHHSKQDRPQHGWYRRRLDNDRSVCRRRASSYLCLVPRTLAQPMCCPAQLCLPTSPQTCASFCLPQSLHPTPAACASTPRRWCCSGVTCRIT